MRTCVVGRHARAAWGVRKDAAVRDDDGNASIASRKPRTICSGDAPGSGRAGE
jgi:hypothetical protein